MDRPRASKTEARRTGNMIRPERRPILQTIQTSKGTAQRSRKRGAFADRRGGVSLRRRLVVLHPIAARYSPANRDGTPSLSRVAIWNSQVWKGCGRDADAGSFGFASGRGLWSRVKEWASGNGS